MKIIGQELKTSTSLNRVSVKNKNEWLRLGVLGACPPEACDLAGTSRTKVGLGGVSFTERFY